MTRNYSEERWDALNHHLEAVGARQALRRYSNMLSEAKGEAISRQAPEVKIAQVQFMAQLVDRRKALHLTQTQLAAKVGTVQPVIARIERGQVSPSLNMIFKLLTALNLTWQVQ